MLQRQKLDALPLTRTTSGFRARPLFVPWGSRPMNVVFFASGGPGNFSAALQVQDSHPEVIRIGLLVTDRPAIPAIDEAMKRGIPTVTGNFDAECGRWRDAVGDSDLEHRYREAARAFHDRMLERILEEESKSNWEFDLAVLAYRRWIHGDLLEYFTDRMINQHPGDLADRGGVPPVRLFTGLHAVWDALDAGRSRTRTSTFLVDDKHDGGEILCRGPWVPAQGSCRGRSYADKHENAQKELSDWPSIRFALAAIGRGEFSICSEDRHADGCRVIAYKEHELPYGGVSLPEQVEVGHDTD